MSPPEKPKGPNKPFLGNEELSSELDAWDSTFDALHGGPEAGQGNEQVMAWPTPAPEPAVAPPPVRTRIPEAALTDELDEQMTLDHAIDLPKPRSRRPAPTANRLHTDPAETDFSDIGAAGSPSTLGDILGGTTEDDDTGIATRGGVPVVVDEDDVYTSASRPNVGAPSDDLALPEDPIAAPRVLAPQVKRVGPAIIRRATPVAVPLGSTRPSSDEQGSPFTENTRVADVDARVADSRSKAPTAPPPFAFFSSVSEPAIEEDDYADIEIGADAPSDPSTVPEPAAPRRTVAHVLRRPEKATKPPVAVGRRSDPVIEVRTDEGAQDVSEPASEDDFSDVAAAVGASEDGPIGDPEIPRRRPSTPRGEVHEVSPANPEPEIDAGGFTPHAGLDAALDDSDDYTDSIEIDLATGVNLDLNANAHLELGSEPASRDEEDFGGDQPDGDEDLSQTRVGAPRAPASNVDEHSGDQTAPPFGGAAGRAQVPAGDQTPPPFGGAAHEVAPRETLLDVRGGRPPALTDLYPRTKTPTAIPGRVREPGFAEGAIPDALRTSPGVGSARPPRLQSPLPFADEIAETEPQLDLEVVQLPEQVQPLASSTLDEEAAQALAIYERELEAIDDSSTAAALRIEAGRLSERLGEHDRARAHYDSALLADPRATAALRGLRRLARSSSDLAEATRQLDAELAVAGALERRPLGHYRIDLLLASGEQDLARVAVGEILDSAPSDVRALLAQLELAFLDGRADEFGAALEQLSKAVTDNELRAAVQSARGVLAAHHNDAAAATTWFAAAAESDPASLGARLGAIRQAAAQRDGEATARALLDLARQVEVSDPVTAAALAIRAQDLAPTGETAAAAARLATTAMPGEPFVAKIAAETALAAGDPALAGAALLAWAGTEASPAERTYAAGRAAELDPARGVELWGSVLAADPGDDYAAAQLRTAHVATEATQLAIDVDLAVAADGSRERARLRAAFGLIAQGQLDGAIELLRQGHADHPRSLAFTEALAEALAASNRWSERAKLLADLAADPGEQLNSEVAQLRSALAWEEAVGAAATADPVDGDEVQRTTIAAIQAWDLVLENAQGAAPAAHAAAIVLATRLGDRDVIGEVLARAQTAEQSPWAAASLALRRARLIASGDNDAARAEEALRETSKPGLEDPRRTVWLVLAAARRNELADAATALEERATELGATGASSEAGALRLRAAQLALDIGDASRAAKLLGQVEQALPMLGIVPDLLAAARRRSGDRPSPGTMRPAPAHASGDAFARIVRDADLASAQGDSAAALALYQRALELRPGDPLATLPLTRLAMQIREPAPLAALALSQLRAAEASGDGASMAEAYELLAHIDKELRADPGSAQIALESASQADPSRVDLMHRLEREYAVADQIGELLRLRRAELAQVPVDHKDRAAMVMDSASLAERDQRPDAELTELYRDALTANPAHRLALLHLESIVRRAGGSSELARLEEQIAGYFEGDPRSQAAFFTRAGETLAELGEIDAAVQKFTKADAAQPGHVPALEGWRSAALKGQLWIDVAEAATRQAAAATEPEARARLHHFAGVVLMDKALAGEQATKSFRRTLEADPGHRDAFLRLRLLLEEDANHDELAIVLANFLAHEPDPRAKLEIHRAVAELNRNFLSNRETAKEHYREILAADPNDLRAHAAIADIAWEQGNWQEAADALISRARLERDSTVLTTLCYRLGMLYADRLSDPAMALKAFQRALTYQPDDENTLVRLADLATQTGEWKLALGACERLVKTEQDPDKRALHLHRVAKIFRLGFGDTKRAERAFNLALDGAPTSDEALSQLVQFYRDAGDMTSVRVHLNRVVGTMRTRVAHDPRDGVAYRVIARAMAARGAAGVDGSIPIARAAAELATLLGAASEPERVLLAESRRVDLAPLVRPDADEVLFPRGVQTELRQLFTLLGDRIAKHVGIDLRAYGVGRGDRLRGKDSSVAAHAQDIATALGFGEIDVYVSTRQPYAMVAEPTSPVSLVIGQSIAQGDSRGIRFAAGAALKLAQTSLAIPGRLGADDLGILVVALVRQFQNDFPQEGLDDGAIATQMQKLRRLIPTGLMNDLKPFALAIDAANFHQAQLARDLQITGLRAGLVAAGSIMAGLTILAAQRGTDVPSFLADPVAQGLISFALSEDHASVAR